MLLQKNDSKDTGVINLVCVCVCVCVWAHIHTNAHMYSMKRDWIKNTLCWNIQTFFLDVLHVPYARDSGLQISNLFYFPSRTSQCDSKLFHKNTRTLCVTTESISTICCNVFCTLLGSASSLNLNSTGHSTICMKL